MQSKHVVIIFAIIATTIMASIFVIDSESEETNAASVGDFSENGFAYTIISENSNEVSIARQFLSDTQCNGDLVIPSHVTYEGVTYTVTVIKSCAFYGCTGYDGTLTIPNSVTTIESIAFYGCTGFTGKLNIPSSVTTIELGAFRGCTGFTGLTIPNSVTTIGDVVFQDCTGFTGTLTIPNSVKELGSSIFSGCTKISGINIKISSAAFSSDTFYGLTFYDKNDNKLSATSSNLCGYEFIGTYNHLVRQVDEPPDSSDDSGNSNGYTLDYTMIYGILFAAIIGIAAYAWIKHK